MKTDIYIYGNIDFSGKSAAAKRMMYYAKALADEKNRVYLVSCSNTKICQENFIENEKGIYVLESNSPTTSLQGSLRFLRRMYAFSKTNATSARFLLYPQAYFFLEIWTVFYLIFLKQKKVFYEFNEVKKHYIFLYKENSNSKIKAFFKAAIHKILFFILDHLMRFYAGIICISTNIQTYGKRYNENTIRIPILTNPKLKMEHTDELFADTNSFNIGFSGSIVPGKENLLAFIEVINKVLDKGFDVKFNLCGTVSDKNLSLLTKSCKKENTIQYFGNLDENKLSNFLKQQDLLVVPRGNTLQNKYGFSTKLSDYLNHKKVILITDISDNSLYIKDGYNGFIVEPNNSEAMYEKLIYIIENFSELEESIVENATKTSSDSFDFRLYKPKLQSFLNA